MGTRHRVMQVLADGAVRPEGVCRFSPGFQPRGEMPGGWNPPVESPVESRVESRAESPVESPVESRVQSPVESPVPGSNPQFP